MTTVSTTCGQGRSVLNAAGKRLYVENTDLTAHWRIDGKTRVKAAAPYSLPLSTLAKGLGETAAIWVLTVTNIAITNNITSSPTAVALSAAMSVNHPQRTFRFRPIADIAAVAKRCDVMTRHPKESVLRIAMGLTLLALVCAVAYLWFAERKPPTGLVMILNAATLAMVWTIRRLEARNEPNS